MSGIYDIENLTEIVYGNDVLDAIKTDQGWLIVKLGIIIPDKELTLVQ